MTSAAATAVATIDPKPQGLSADVRRMEKQFALALPEHVSPERFVRVVVTAIQSNPDLQKADRDSVLGAALKCAQDGLLPDGREAALVVYGGKAAYLPMIAGVLTKVRRSGELLTIAAHVVYENDAFTYRLGDDEMIEHQPFMDGPRGKAKAVYAVAKTKDGGIYREVMSLEEVTQVRNVSRAKNGGPWVQWWGEMARKTVLRRLAKRLPMSTDLQQVFQRDDDHYDLSRAAEGQAKLRRLHADFDDIEPPEALTEPDKPHVANEDPEIIEAEVEDKTAIHPDLKTGAQLRAEQQTEGPGDAEQAPPASAQTDLLGDVDVIEWAGALLRSLGDFSDVAELRAAWGLHKVALQKASPGLFKQLNEAVVERAQEIEAA